MDLFSTTAVAHSAIKANTELGTVLASREKVLAMTQQAENAVLKPRQCGSYSPALRAAFAARIAHHHHLRELAEHYEAQIDDATCLPIADIKNTGEALGLSVVLEYMDRVAVAPHDVVDADIIALQEVGVSDADIVRLTELNAFMAYQVRLISGLALMSRSVS